jgi:uncharacterized membrane protein
MQPRAFLSELDDRRIVQAIAEAERASSGEIRVYVSEKQVEDVVSEAKVHFLRLGMEKTRERNGVMIYIAPRSRNFAVVGDIGIHQKCGDTLWQEVAGMMEEHLKAGRYTDALLAAVSKIGSILATHFPRQADDQNELPDEIAGD